MSCWEVELQMLTTWTTTTTKKKTCYFSAGDSRTASAPLQQHSAIGQRGTGNGLMGSDGALILEHR
jgi:hypothetical protein